MNELKKGYKMTELGMIPEDWEVKQLGEMVTFQRGFDLPARHRKRSGSIPVVSSAGVTDFHDEAKHQSVGVVTGRYGTIGKVFFMQEPFWPLNTTLYIKDFHNNSPKFIFHLLETFDFHVFSGKSGVPGINRNDLHSEKVLLPPLPEQRAIATALSDVDALIAALEAVLTKKRQIKQAMMQELLTGKRRLAGFTGAWEVKRLGDVATLKARIGWQGLTTSEYLTSGEYYLVTGTEFKNGGIDWNKCHYVAQSRYNQDKNIQLLPDDVLVTKDGTIGKIAYISNLSIPATLNSGVFVIRPLQKSFYPRFFFYLLQSSAFIDFLNQLSAGSTINHLYQKDFVNFRYQVPPTFEEQRAIAAILSDLDAEISALEARITKTRTLKQGMMQELLTGKTRLVSSVQSEQTL